MPDPGVEIAQLLSELIQVDTTNPPGNETEAAKLLADWLSDRGVSSTIVEGEKSRGNLVATIGEGEPSILLLSHLDVVPANPREWSVHPFSGKIRDGFVWGRGAIDCKSLVAVEAYLTAEFASREDFGGKIVFAATADEERGGGRGVGWLVENRPDLLRASFGINEGGGLEIPGKKGSLFTVQVAEKGVYWFRVVFKGKPGHASMPLIGDNALSKAAKFIEAINSRRPRITPTKVARHLVWEFADIMGLKPLAPLLLNPLTGDAALRALGDKRVAAMMDAILRNTLTPTMLESGKKENTIPSKATLTVDARLLPGYSEEWLLDYLKDKLPENSELSFIHREPPSESPTGTRLYGAIERAVAELVPGSRAVPFIVPGGTDSRYLRWRYGIPIYGFQSMRADLPLGEILSMVHGVDERISIENLEFGYRVLRRTLEAFFEGKTIV